MDSPIKSLFKRVKKGDKVAACKLVETCYADIFAYLRRLCGSQADGEDLTQETFIKVWRGLGNYRGRSKFSTWVYSIAYNTYVDWRRRQTGNKTLSEPWWKECIDQNPSPFANAAERQTAERLYEAVDQLDENKKHVVHLHYYQGLSLRETAKVLNISTSTVKYRLREVIKILRASMGAQENEFKQKETITIAEGEPV